MNRSSIGFVAKGVSNGLVDIRNLMFVVVSKTRDRTCVAGFGGGMVDWGVKWGGARRNLFWKDLSLPPIRKSGGRHLDLGRPDVVDLALRLEQLLDLAGFGLGTRSQLAKVESVQRLNYWSESGLS